eukprot:2110919-Lingulodinium_polyedra.AAC.1
MVNAGVLTEHTIQIPSSPACARLIYSGTERPGMLSIEAYATLNVERAIACAGYARETTQYARASL